jgi:hypothetical protein
MFGYDTVGLDTDSFGTSGMTNQSVAGIMGYDLGSFGLSPESLNFSDVTNSSLTFFGTLQANTRISSRTWSFTQGTYKGKWSFLAFIKTLLLTRVENSSIPNFAPSLIFGGYDEARINKSTTITVAMDLDTQRALSVKASSISIIYDDGPTFNVPAIGAEPFHALIDSSVPYMLLPIDICKIIERILGLHWDSASGMYPISQNDYDRLKTSNGTVLMNVGGSYPSTTVYMPIESLILHAGMPLVANSTRFLAIKQATGNETQYTLGRAFLQNAYITADYDKRIFNLSRVMHTSDSRPMALPAGLPPIPRPPPDTYEWVASIIVPIIVVLLIVAYLFFAWKKKKLPFRKKKPPFSREKVKEDDLDMTLKAELSGEGLPRAEADSSFEKFEAPDTQKEGELFGDMVPVELPGVEARYELNARP